MPRIYVFEELVDKKFNKLTIKEMLPNEKGKSKKFKCLCECGKYKTAYLFDLKSGKVQMCDECSNKIRIKRLDKIRPFKGIDITNKRIGRLTTIRLATMNEIELYKPNIADKTRRFWLCLCDCGNQIVIEQRNLTCKNPYQSCGCLRSVHHLIKTSMFNLSEEYILNFKDTQKYGFLHKAFVGIDPNKRINDDYEQFIERFYFDINFNAIYDFWLKESERTSTFYDLAKPSVDHIVPYSKSKDGSVNNLQFLTVFENLSKRDMTMEEWEQFKISTNTTSELFIENILKKARVENYVC